MRKAVWTLNIGNYEPEITALTYPLFAQYAEKIGADFRVISRREFPAWPVVYEKLQIHNLGRSYDWNIYFDSDAMIHPDLFDITEFISKDTVLQNAKDLAATRWKYDRYFQRDGRHIGACNWFTVASDWCLDLWHPLEDLSPQGAIANIKRTVSEANVRIQDEHLIDDYALSRNIARFGLKHTTFMELLKKLDRESDSYFWHRYTETPREKLQGIREVMVNWGLNGIRKPVELMETVA